MSQSFERSTPLLSGAAAEQRRRRFEALCAPFRTDLYRFVFWLCRDRALTDDVLQETLLRAWKSLDRLSDADAVRPWLLTIARRELARVFERKRAPTVDLEAAEGAEGVWDSAESHELQDMRRAIAELEVLYREPLIMQVLLGMTTDEIAKQLEISTAAVLTRLFRARQLLRKRLLGADGEDVCA